MTEIKKKEKKRKEKKPREQLSIHIIHTNSHLIIRPFRSFDLDNLFLHEMCKKSIFRLLHSMKAELRPFQINMREWKRASIYYYYYFKISMASLDKCCQLSIQKRF